MSVATAPAETNPNILPFEVDGLFDDAVVIADAEASLASNIAAAESVDPEADTVITTPAEDEDDGPQPGDDMDDVDADIMDDVLGQMVEDDVAEQNEARAAGGITQAENALVQIWNAERRCGIAKAAWNSAKEAAKEAKDEYDGCVDELRRLARAAELDADRPLLAAAEAVNAAEASRVADMALVGVQGDDDDDKPGSDDDAMFDDDEIAKNMTSDAVNEHLRVRLQPGQLRIRLLKEVINEHPQRGKLTFVKGVSLTVSVDSNGTAYIPFDDDPTDGTGLEAEEFDILDEPATTDIGQDDPRFELSLAETAISTATVKLLAAANINTVREFEAWRVAGYTPKVDKLGQGKIEKAEAALVEFWAGK